jgi:acyl-coenzyme A synthetase/AMP-(fatty) acid ligase
LNLIDTIQQAAFRNPAAPAFIYNGRMLTYRNFFNLLCAATRLLHEHGIRHGTVVGMSFDQSPLHIIVMLALARLGAVSVPLHPMLPRAHKAMLVTKYGIGTIVSHHDEFRIDGTAFIKIDTLTPDAAMADTGFAGPVPDGETPFRISLSSGTTGEPKGVLFTQGYLLERIGMTLYECDINSRVIPFDLNFALGFVFAIGVLTVGGVVVFPRQPKPQVYLQTINLFAVTHVSLPPVLAVWMESLLPDPGVACPSLKHLRIVGETLQSSLVKSLRAKLTPNIYVPYGLTELGPISIATPEILATRPDSSGKILPWAKVEILDGEGRILPTGEKGEIRVAVDGMPAGYHNDSKQSTSKFRDGWFYPGDHGRISEDGQLFIEGRIDDMINLDGHKISPAHVEEILLRHPDVKEAVAFALKSKTGQHDLVAAIIPRAGTIRQEELTELARQHLGMFYPKQYFLMRDFPRSTSGKVLRAEVPAAALKNR